MAMQNLKIETFFCTTFKHYKKSKLCQICNETYRPVGIIYPIHANFCYKSNSRSSLWVSRSTFHLQAVYSVLVVGLKQKEAAVTCLHADPL